MVVEVVVKGENCWSVRHLIDCWWCTPRLGWVLAGGSSPRSTDQQTQRNNWNTYRRLLLRPPTTAARRAPVITRVEAAAARCMVGWM